MPEPTWRWVDRTVGSFSSGHRGQRSFTSCSPIYRPCPILGGRPGSIPARKESLPRLSSCGGDPTWPCSWTETNRSGPEPVRRARVGSATARWRESNIEASGALAEWSRPVSCGWTPVPEIVLPCGRVSAMPKAGPDSSDAPTSTRKARAAPWQLWPTGVARSSTSRASVQAARACAVGQRLVKAAWRSGPVRVSTRNFRGYPLDSKGDASGGQVDGLRQ